MAKETRSTIESDAQISEKISEIAELISTKLAASLPGQMMERFKCTVDYACKGAEFTCTTFRCPGSFKVEERA